MLLVGDSTTYSFYRFLSGLLCTRGSCKPWTGRKLPRMHVGTVGICNSARNDGGQRVTFVTTSWLSTGMRSSCSQNHAGMLSHSHRKALRASTHLCGAPAVKASATGASVVTGVECEGSPCDAPDGGKDGIIRVRYCMHEVYDKQCTSVWPQSANALPPRVVYHRHQPPPYVPH